MSSEHIFAIGLECSLKELLEYPHFHKNPNVIRKTEDPQESSKSRITLAFYKYSLIGALPKSSMLQKVLFDVIEDFNVSLDYEKKSFLCERTTQCCDIEQPIINKPSTEKFLEPIHLTGTQHDKYFKPDIFQFQGSLRLYRLYNRDESKNKTVMIPFVPVDFKPDNFLRTLRNFCQKRTLAVLIDDSSQPRYYHALFLFKKNINARRFADCLISQLFLEIGKVDVAGQLMVYPSDESVRFLLCPLLICAFDAYPSIDRNACEDCVELPRCAGCLSLLDETIIQWDYVPIALNSNNHYPNCSHSTLVTKCYECDESVDTWCCLICGYVACGRYKQSHGIRHYNITGHSLTIKLNSSLFIWDYCTDKCVQKISTSPAAINKDLKKKKDDKKNDQENNEGIGEEKKALTILELNELYTSATEHTSMIQDIVYEDKKRAYIESIAKLEKENEELKKIWNEMGGQKGCNKRLKQKMDKLKKAEKEREDEAEIGRCLESNLKIATDEYREKLELYKNVNDELSDLKLQSEQLMKSLNMI